jgi:hypothetical protein
MGLELELFQPVPPLVATTATSGIKFKTWQQAQDF